MTLRRFVMGEMTWRELRDFVAHLPRNSALGRELHGEAAEWTPTTHAVASLWDWYAAVHTGRGKPPIYPRPEIPDN